MKIRNKSLLAFFGILLALIFATQAIATTVVLNGYGALEEKEMDRDLNRVSQAVSADLDHLMGDVSDWAVWDDTYNFVQTNDSTYVTSNIADNSFISLDINLIIVVNSSNEIMICQGFNLENKSLSDAPQDLIDKLTMPSFINNIAEMGEGSGLVSTSDGTVMAAGHLILKSDGTGPSKGCMFMARYLDDASITQIENRTSLSFDIENQDNPNIQSDIQEARLALAGTNGTYYNRINGTAIAGYRTINGISNDPLYILKVITPRNIYTQGQSTLNFLTFSLAIMAIAISILMLVILGNLVVVPITGLNRDVKAIGKSKSISGRLNVTGSDEFSELRSAVNEMLQELELFESNLKTSEERYRGIVEDQTELIVRFSPEWKVSFANEATSRYFGSDGTNYVGQSLTSIPGGAELVASFSTSEIAPSGSPTTLEVGFKDHEGTDRWILWTVRGIFDGYGKISEFQAVGMDISLRKQAEIALEQANKKLSLMGSITRHDMLNHLTTAIARVQLLEMETVDQSALGHLERLERTLGNIRKEIEFTRDYQSMGVSMPQWISTAEAVTKAASELKAPGVEVKTSLDRLDIYSDPLLQIVFYNLMDNSIRHGEHVTVISFSFMEIADGLVLVYQDNGSGIPEELKERIFEAGFGKNTGYGLFLVREILGTTGMTIKETGEEGKGARFEIYIPRDKYRLSL